jgi:hypothetical protein
MAEEKQKVKQYPKSNSMSHKQLIKSSIWESRGTAKGVKCKAFLPMMRMAMKAQLPHQTKFKEITDCSGFHPLQGLHLTSAKWQMKVTNVKKVHL